MAKKHKLNFPKEKGRYWYLYWKGETFLEDKTFKVILHFVNKSKPDLDVNDFNTNETVVQKINSSSLIYFNLGSVFDAFEFEIVQTQEIDKGNPLLKRDFNNMSVKTLTTFYPAKKKFPLLGNPQFPKVDGLDKEEITFMKYRNQYNNSNGTKTIYSVIVDSYCLLDYFFFRSSRIINKILSGQVLIAFKVKDIKVIKNVEENTKTVVLPYDNHVISKTDALIIAPSFFIKEKFGIKMLNSIYSSLNRNFRQNKKDENQQISGYIDLFFTTSNYEFTLAGLPYHDHNSEKNKQNEEKKEKKEKKEKDIHRIFYASKIKSFSFLEDDMFDYDNVILVPLFPNKKNDSDDNELTNGSNSENNDDAPVLNLYLNKRASRSNSIKPDQIKTDQVSPFNINVKIEPFLGDKKTLLNLLSENNIDGVSTEDNKDNPFEELLLLHQDAEKLYLKTTVISNLQYFSNVVKELKMIAEVSNHPICINDDPLGIGRESYPYEMNTEINYLIDIVEIQHLHHFMYAVEFGHGMIGIFNHRNFNKLDSELLLYFLKEFISKDVHQPKKGTVTERDKENGFLLWTIIRRKFNEEFLSQLIEVKPAVKHIRKDHLNVNDAFKKTAEKILGRLIN